MKIIIHSKDCYNSKKNHVINLFSYIDINISFYLQMPTYYYILYAQKIISFVNYKYFLRFEDERCLLLEEPLKTTKIFVHFYICKRIFLYFCLQILYIFFYFMCPKKYFFFHTCLFYISGT